VLDGDPGDPARDRASTDDAKALRHGGGGYIS
jgi:hypothetical protein